MDTSYFNDRGSEHGVLGAPSALDAPSTRTACVAGLLFMDPEQCTQRFMPVVRRMARNLKRLLPSSVELDDLVQFGLLGLLRAVRRYRGAPAEFQCFAVPRIRSAMIEGLPALDCAPLELRRNVRHIRDCICGLEQKLRRTPSPREIAAALGLSLQDYQRILCEHDAYRPATVSQSIRLNGEDTDPLSMLQHHSTIDALVGAIGVLPRREQLMLQCRYGDAMPLDAIGARFGVSESRVCQVLKHTLARLRASVPT